MKHKLFVKKVKFLKFILLFISMFTSIEFYAQCAGSNNSITICAKETYDQGLGNPTGVLNLFNLLGGTPIIGGTWQDLNSSGGLNITNGLLNTWQINQSGVYNYRYTRNGIPGCTTNTAIITVTLGGFPGVNNANAVACNNTTSVPLFSFLGSNPNPHFNGTWSGGPAGALTGNFFNAQLAGTGNFTLTYTVPAISSCPSRSANVTLTVHPLPNAGTPTPLFFCETDDLSTFTAVDLFNQLAGEDGGGFWVENSGTSEISGAGDSIIDIENIFNTFGTGTYTFTYNVNPSHPICAPANANVAIIIEPVVDLNGATLVVAPNLCFNELATSIITGTITQGINPIADGTYNITYVLTGVNTGTETITVTFVGGVASFTINSSFITNTGVTSVEITSVLDPATASNCERVISNLTANFEVFDNPNISNTNITIDDICINQSAEIVFNDINGPTIELIDGSYTITFDITGPSGTVTNQTSTVTIVNGGGISAIASLLTPLEGNYTVTITNIENTATNCSTNTNLIASFEVLPIPDAQTIIVSIDDICDGEDVIVILSGATNLTNGLYDIDYSITGAITVSNQVESNVSFSGGNATFTLPSGILLIGVSNLTINNLFSTTSTCTTTTFDNPTDTFEIHAIPDASDIDISVDDICLGQDALVSIFDTNIGVAPELTDGTYTITYDLSGTNTISGQSTTATIIGGLGSFLIPASQLTNIGLTNLVLTIITNNTTGCDAVGVPISTSFTVLEIPNIDNTTISVLQPLCFGQDATVTISGTSLDDGNYDLNYDLTGTNTALNQMISVVFTSGNSTFAIPSALIPNLGTTTISILNIVDTNFPNACASSVMNVSADFIVSENPNTSTSTITAEDPICLGSNGEVFFSDAIGTLSDGQYSITYDLSGNNTASNNIGILNFTAGNGSFIIPSSLLLNTGNTTITLTSITNTTTGCNSLMNTIINFEILPLPNVSGANLIVVEPICLGNGTTVDFNSPLLIDGNYSITYNISGANTATNTVVITISGGNATFSLPNTEIPNGGSYTITITAISSVTTMCESSPISISDDFIVSPNPDITIPEITIDNICLGSDATVTFISTGGLVDGNYSINYTLTGVNGPLTQTDAVVVSGGIATITIPAGVLLNIGTNTFTVNSITNTNTTCSTNFSGISVDFEIYPLPNFTPSNISVIDVCLNSDGVAAISNALNLIDGTYTVTYNLSGVNIATNESAVVIITSNTGDFIIPGSLLNTVGLTTIEVISISNNATTCSTTGLSVTADFNVIALPNTTGATFSIVPICVNNDATVIFANATSLVDGSYTFIYNLSGANTSSDNSVSVIITSGSGTFTIPSTLLLNGGTTTVTIADLVNGITMCGTSSLATSPVSFVITDPATPTIGTGGNLFCIQDGPTISNLTATVSGLGTITWYDSPTSTTPLNPNDLLSDENTYYASVIDINNCESSIKLEVTVDLKGCDDLFIPDGFSPNADGLNDTFYIKDLEILFPNFTLEIYNRYGSIVYKGDINTPNFDGKSNYSTVIGKDVLPTGVYFFVLYFNDSNNTNPKQGRLYLSR